MPTRPQGRQRAWTAAFIAALATSSLFVAVPLVAAVAEESRALDELKGGPTPVRERLGDDAADNVLRAR